MDQPPANRRRFRFGLRTLLAVVTLAAVGSWAYWIGWPWWVMNREQIEFEKSVRNIKVGMTPNAGAKLVQWNKTAKSRSTFWDVGRDAVLLDRYSLPNAIYCIYYVIPRDHSDSLTETPCTRVEVFCLPPVPAGYQAKSHMGQQHAAHSHGAIAAELEFESYMFDFLEFVTGNRSNNYGNSYELIYSDPPANPAAK